MSKTKECSHCFSTIDARATVCPQCRRDIPHPPAEEVPKKEQAKTADSLIAPLAIIFVIFLAFAGMARVFGDSDATPSDKNCSRSTSAYQSCVRDIMEDYLDAHGVDDSMEKVSLRQRAGRITEPDGVTGAEEALFGWFRAVDNENLQGTDEAIDRFLDALN